MRGRLVSFNQLNIVIGISAAFFSNYLILQLAASDLAWANALGFEQWNWRWMLEVELLPALLYFIGLFYPNDVSFKQALRASLGESEALTFESEAITAAITMNPTLILMGILGFVASFAISIGPVMWVLFSELFPIHIKGAAISFVGFINSLISYLVQQFFPWQLDTFGSSTTFLIYGIFAAVGVLFVIWVVPETKNKFLEELQNLLVKK